MVVVDVSLMSPKVIGKKVHLQARSPYGLSKDLELKRHPNTWRKEESKEIRDFVKVEDGNVHHKKYNGCCTKQLIRNPKVTWTSPILWKRSTWQTSFHMASLMKDNVKVKVPNKTPKTLIPFDGVLKFGGKLEGDHVTHFLG